VAVAGSGVAHVGDQSSFEWRKYTFEQLLTGGRGCSFIERNATGKVVGIWPLDPVQTSVHREGARKFFKYRDGRRTVTYEAAEVIDLAFMLKSDGLKHRSPIMDAADSIGLARAMTLYGSRFFNNGGVPPFAIEGNFQSGAAMQRAAADLEEAVLKSKRDSRLALVLPMGLKITPIGTDAQKSQMIEAQRFIIEEIARRYSLPPVFLQDLTHGTFSNNEQQDLHLTKHTIKRYAEQFEQECNLKLFGWKKRDRFVELNLDGLLRGDFKTRMEGYASAIQSGQMTPGETRDMENRPRLPGDDKLYMQGAMMPLNKLGLADPIGGTTNGA
jgi:HK97 family phage portal protein